MAQLKISLHRAQSEIWADPARFKVVAAGRRFGKTYYGTRYATVGALSEVSFSRIPVGVTHEVGYIFPTFEQAKRVVWPKFREFLAPLEPNHTPGGLRMFENTGVIEFPNGAKIRLLGADNPDSIRGLGFRRVVLDEYKDMDPYVWEEIIRPALMDVGGDALFIGTPKGKNHFYDLYKRASRDKTGTWAAFSYTSEANTALPPGELADTMRDMSSQLIKQEIEASFLSQGGNYFQPHWFPESSTEPDDGEWVVTADLAGFRKVGTGTSANIKRLDDHAIATVKVHRKGWWIKNIRYGQWDTRECALQMFLACREVGTSRIGIEKGLAASAVIPYFTDLMRKYSRWIDVIELSHGNKNKADRIQWALQGRAEKHEIVLNKGDWTAKFLEQACDFPDPRTHDDLLDAVAYVDQMATTMYLDESDFTQEYVPVDEMVGY